MSRPRSLLTAENFLPHLTRNTEHYNATSAESCLKHLKKVSTTQFKFSITSFSVFAPSPKSVDYLIPQLFVFRNGSLNKHNANHSNADTRPSLTFTGCARATTCFYTSFGTLPFADPSFM